MSASEDARQFTEMQINNLSNCNRWIPSRRKGVDIFGVAVGLRVRS